MNDGDDDDCGQEDSVVQGRGDGPPSPDIQREILRVQVDIVLELFPGAAAFPAERSEPLQYLYREGRILVRDSDLDRVLALVGGEVVDALAHGVTALQPEGRTTTEALEEIDAALGIGVATPEHLFWVVPVRVCPAGEPVPAPGPDPDPAVATMPADRDGSGSVVCVVDTGIIPSLVDRHDWLSGVTGDVEEFDESVIGPYVGHGTFVAGMVRTVAPQSEVHVLSLLGRAGAVDESTLSHGLQAALEIAPDVISMSAGCTTRHSLPPLVFLAFWEQRLRHTAGTVLVAAAGNDSSRQPFWPAAFPWAVSVGATDRTGGRAWYSNTGSWVDTYALGSDVVNAYPIGSYTYTEPPRRGQSADFATGLAVWSGTSFATPTVAGMIAARRSLTGQSGRRAADSVLRIALRNAVPGVGPVADPSQSYDAD